MDFATGVVGLLVGFFAGLTGVGGAALLMPLLIWAGIPAATAVGTDLFYNSITKCFGGLQHWRQGSVHWKLVSYLAAGSIPGAVVSVGLLAYFDSIVEQQEELFRSVLGVMLVVAAISILMRIVLRSDRQENKWQKKTLEEKRGITVAVGFALGFIVGLTSIGSGALFAVVLMSLFRLRPAEVVGTDIVHAFFLVSVAGLLHAGLGNVDYMLALNLLLGSVPGVLMGSFLSSRLPSTPLRMVIVSFILLSGIKLI